MCDVKAVSIFAEGEFQLAEGLSEASNSVIFLFYFGCTGVFVAVFFPQAFCSCSERGPLLVGVCSLSIAAAALAAEHRLRHVGSSVASCGLSSC